MESILCMIFGAKTQISNKKNIKSWNSKLIARRFYPFSKAGECIVWVTNVPNKRKESKCCLKGTIPSRTQMKVLPKAL